MRQKCCFYKRKLRADCWKYHSALCRKLSHISSIKQLKRGKPRDYWQLLKKMDWTDNMAKKINPDTYCSFVKHFKELNKSDDSNESNLNYIINNSRRHADPDPFINRPFSTSEVCSIIKGLSNQKAVGIDGLANEYLKASLMFSLVNLTKIFNLVLDSGIIPKNWAVGIIRPILKSNGQTDNPDNYRGITILSCLGKVITSLLNAR